MTQPLSSSTLTAYLTENPAELAKYHRLNDRLYQVAAAILFLSSVALLSVVLGIYFGFAGTTSVSKTMGLTVNVGAGGLLMGSSYCLNASQEHNRYSTRNELLNTYFQKIKNYTENDVRQFYKDKKVSIEQIPTETMAKLKQINPQQPLKALIPLIARYQVSEENTKKGNAYLLKLENLQKETEQNTKLSPTEKSDQLKDQKSTRSNIIINTMHYNAMYIHCINFTGLPDTTSTEDRLRAISRALLVHA
jgi:hypothetical protein